METATYRCPQCGGGLLFDPETKHFVCEYCRGSFTLAELEAPAEGETQSQSSQEETNAMLYACPSCGATVVTDETTAATLCYYCHNPVVVSGRLSGEMKPDCLIPFAIDREEAVRRFEAWIATKRFVPRAFYAKQQIEKFTGVYFPYWLVDCAVEGSMETNGTRLRVWRVADTEFTETSHFRLRRAGRLHFADLSRLALKKADRRLIESVMPFEMGAAQTFSMPYLSGFEAEIRDIDRQETEPEVRTSVERYTESMLRDTIRGYATFSGESTKCDVSDADWRYLLLPVWVLTYQYRGKTYFYAMNGQTGTMGGMLPVSRLRLAALFGMIFVPLLLILSIMGVLL